MLLAGTTLGLLVVVVGSVGLLWAMGGQALPGVLTGGAAPAKRD